MLSEALEIGCAAKASYLDHSLHILWSIAILALLQIPGANYCMPRRNIEENPPKWFSFLLEENKIPALWNVGQSSTHILE